MSTKEKVSNPASVVSSGGQEASAVRLNRWFATQCNGDWEHMNGVKIETTDNPGWWVRIEIDGTTSRLLSGKGQRGKLSWEVEKANGVLHGYDEESGDLEGLSNLLVDVLESKLCGNCKCPIAENATSCEACGATDFET